jgi:glyoxylase-like metal-dependent hydrolase (beta-lactamase superfamily II)
MYFRQFLDELCGCASYLIASRETREAAIVDPSVALQPYQEVLEARDFQLRYVVDTHVHADHVSGARALIHMYPEAALCMHEATPAVYPVHRLRDGDELALGQVRLRVLHAPGHRAEHMALLVINRARSPEPELVLTGDSLLAGDVGRPDFGGGDASAQFDTIARLCKLPEWVAVFPGHFEGPCGKAMEGRSATTIGFEHRFNSLARLEREQFVASLISDVPARPLNMTAIEATNRGLADMAWAMPTAALPVPEIAADALEAPPADAMLVDVREPAEYARGHVPGALSLPQADLASRLEELPRDRPLLLICRTGSRSQRAAQYLLQMGFAHVANIAGGTLAWRAAGKPLLKEG